MNGDWPRWIAHRAGGNAAPENTLAGVPLAAACGLRAVEVDIRLAADGVPVVIHDDTLDRTCDRPGLVDRLTSRELERIPADRGFEATQHAGAVVPALATLLRVVAQHGLHINLELKSGPEPAEALVAPVVAVLADLAWALPPGRLLLSAFEWPLLAAARRQMPHVPRALLCDGDPGWAVGAALALECDALHVAARQCSPVLLARATQAGLAVRAWTVNDLAQAQALFGLGAAGVFSDRLDLARVAA